MNKFKLQLIFSLLALSMNSTGVNAANLYRFHDHNGIVTMSKSLPPYAAQKGYDILDANSLRLLKRVAPALTQEQILQKKAEEQKQLEEQKRQAEAIKVQKEKNRQQKIIDQNLIARFSSENELLEARDKELHYYKVLLKKTQDDLEDNQNRLRVLQKKAGQKELSGHGIGDKLKRKLTEVQNDINTNNRNIESIKREALETENTYRQGLVRLTYLLSLKKD